MRCNNPEAEFPITFAYYKGRCVSICTFQGINDVGDTVVVLQDNDCTSGNICCVFKKQFCVNDNGERIIIDE